MLWLLPAGVGPPKTDPPGSHRARGFVFTSVWPSGWSTAAALLGVACRVASGTVRLVGKYIQPWKSSDSPHRFFQETAPNHGVSRLPGPSATMKKSASTSTCAEALMPAGAYAAPLPMAVFQNCEIGHAYGVEQGEGAGRSGCKAPGDPSHAARRVRPGQLVAGAVREQRGGSRGCGQCKGDGGSAHGRVWLANGQGRAAPFRFRGRHASQGRAAP